MRLQAVRRPDPLHRAQRHTVAAAIARPVQCVASPGGSANVSATTRSISAGGNGGKPGFRVFSRNRPATPSRMNRSCQRQTHGFETPARRIISAVPQPSAVARMIRARQTGFCGLFRSATTAANRSRSPVLTSTLIPARMTHHRMPCANMESYDCVAPLGDVIVEEHDIFGDGVNIAARLEGLAEPGAICLSEQAYWQVKGRLDLKVTDLGPRPLKDIAEPVRLYSLKVGQPAARKPTSNARLGSAPIAVAIAWSPLAAGTCSMAG